MYKYDAAISYASFSEEDKEFAKKIAERLSENDIKVFFYNWCRVELLGENLYEKLAQIYRDESLFAIPIKVIVKETGHYLSLSICRKELKVKKQHIYYQ